MRRPIAARFGTPCYVYDLDVVDRQVDALRAVLPPVTDIAYAVKANPALAIVAHLGARGTRRGRGVGRRAGDGPPRRDRPGRIVMTGPGKRDEELRAAVAAGIRAVTVESPGELARLEPIAADAGRRVPVMLRAAVTEDARLERVRLVGDDGAGKFGMDATDLVAAARLAARSPHLEWLGLHAFGASNVLDAERADRACRGDGARRARARPPRRRRRSASSTPAAGSGSRTSRTRTSLDLARLGRGIADITAAWPNDALLRDARLLLEPGRFLVGPAGAYLARVVDRKTVDGSTVVILDGGVHHVLRPALVGQEHRVRAVSGHAPRCRGARLGPVTVAGPLCSGLDVFSQHAVMARRRSGT